MYLELFAALVLKTRLNNSNINFADFAKFILNFFISHERGVGCTFVHWEVLEWEESCSSIQDGLSLVKLTMTFSISSINSWNCQDKFPALNSSHLPEATQKE